MSLLHLMQKRHSIRLYNEQPIPEAALKEILEAGLLSASGRSRRPWELILVRDKETLIALAEARENGSAMLKKAAAAIVVVANPEISDTWIEDSSIVMANMHLMASSLGVGSCWIQGRMRQAKNGQTTEAFLREKCHFPEEYRLVALLSLGMPAEEKKETALADLPWEKIHQETF